MEHLIELPQAYRAWSSIPEPWVALGAAAALGTDLELAPVTPVTFRVPGITRRPAATSTC